MGVQRAESLPDKIRPTLLSILGYEGVDSIFLWHQVVDAGLEAPSQTSLDFYRSYDATLHDLQRPHHFFDSWQMLVNILPLSVIIRCSDMSESSLTFLDHYSSVTNDTTNGCAPSDLVWFSPACRADTSECVPLLLRYDFEMNMQIAFFLNMPVAVVRVREGPNKYEEYYTAIRGGRFLFSYWTPDDTLIDDAGRPPVELVMPPPDEVEQWGGVYHSGTGRQRVRSYAWNRLAEVDRDVSDFAARINFGTGDIKAMMRDSRLLKAVGGPAAEDAAVSWAVACAWVRANEPRWAGWLPAKCTPGFYLPDAAPDCRPCPPGKTCAGNLHPPADCPVGHYCPGGGGNTSDSFPCPAGRTTAGAGAADAAACSPCVSGAFALPGAGGCVEYAVALPAIVLPAVAALALLAALAHRRRLARAKAAWLIPAAELAYPDPPEVLGCGSQGGVVRALLRGTSVAVKRLRHRPARAPAGGAGGGPEGSALGWRRASRRRSDDLERGEDSEGGGSLPGSSAATWSAQSWGFCSDRLVQ
jgi:hypothetical protein